MRRVQQRDERGCGIACVAMLTGQSYKTIREYMFPSGEVKRTRSKQLIEALNYYEAKLVGQDYFLMKGRSYRRLAFDAILRVDSGYHWVVWDSKKGRILDPARKEPKRHYYECTSYIQAIRHDDRRLWPRFSS